MALFSGRVLGYPSQPACSFTGNLFMWRQVNKGIKRVAHWLGWISLMDWVLDRLLGWKLEVSGIVAAAIVSVWTFLVSPLAAVVFAFGLGSAVLTFLGLGAIEDWRRKKRLREAETRAEERLREFGLHPPRFFPSHSVWRDGIALSLAVNMATNVGTIEIHCAIDAPNGTRQLLDAGIRGHTVASLSTPPVYYGGSRGRLDSGTYSVTWYVTCDDQPFLVRDRFTV